MNWKKILIPVLLLSLGFISMITLINMREEAPKKEKQIHPKTVDAVVVQPANIEPSITAYGRVTSAQPVQLISEVAGEILPGNIPFKPAQSFKKGDLIVKVDDRLAALTLNSLKSDFLNALAAVLPDIKVDFPNQFKTWDNYFAETNFEKPLKAMPVINDKKLKLYLSRSNVFKLYYAIKQAEINLEKHNFYAPFNGSIVSADLRIGSTARSGSKLGEIINLDELEVEVPVPAENISYLNSSKQVRFSSTELDGTWFGQIRRIGQNIDSRTQSIPAFVSIENKTALPNGVFLTADLPGKSIGNAVVVPRQAIYNDQYVYLIKNEQLFFQKVGIAFKQIESVIVTSGLTAGDTLVVELMQGIAAGMPAKPRLLTGESDGVE
ncbi:MAG: efflux RND transporter periplasmic adaptor subunit [Calditrichae bacterium]|nr:efflux RND transporter periplasmic adaptor subunit [Calditrichia bacterium]